MIYNPDQYCALPLGIVLRRTPGQTRWAKYYWRVSGVLQGAGLASGQVLRSEGDDVEVHAATVTLEMHGAETEAYVHELQAEVPSVYVILREGDTPADAPEAVLATLSPYEHRITATAARNWLRRSPCPRLSVWLLKPLSRTSMPKKPLRSASATSSALTLKPMVLGIGALLA